MSETPDKDVSVPDDIVWKLYWDSVMAELQKQGMSQEDARETVARRSAEAAAIMDTLLNKPVVLWSQQLQQDGKTSNLAAVEEERDQLKAALQNVVDQSFYGDSTGYYHLAPDAYQEACRVLARQNEKPPVPPVSEPLPTVVRRGWRAFECSECGKKWEWATRDRLSPSGEDCPDCGEWVVPYEERADESLPVDQYGNLTVPYNRTPLTPEVNRKVDLCLRMMVFAAWDEKFGDMRWSQIAELLSKFFDKETMDAAITLSRNGCLPPLVDLAFYKEVTDG